MPTGVYKRKMKEVIKSGDKYGMLTAIKFDHRDSHGNQFWLFKCDCGNEKVICVNSVKTGNTESCGCLAKETSRKQGLENRTHGMEGTKTYYVWTNMKQRCSNPNNKSYKNYGARGIKVCKRWEKFENFYKDMGERPENKTLDRIDNDGNYEPINCKWATNIEQANNKRSNHLLTYKGRTKTIAQWAEETEINYDTLYYRLTRYNWSVEKALNKLFKYVI